MSGETFPERLRSACAATIELYHDRFPDAPPLPEIAVGARDDTTATPETVRDQFDDLTAFYDDLFDVDTTTVRDRWRANLVYDPSWREHLRLLTRDLPASLSLVLVGSRYAPTTGTIGVSRGRRSRTGTARALASELCHAYQYEFDSPTWDHPYTREGLEQAAAVQALTHLANTRAHDPLEHAARRLRVRTLLEGCMAHATRDGDPSPAALRDLGLTEAELATVRAGRPRRYLGWLRPRYRWAPTAYNPEYVLVGSLLLVSDRAGVSFPYARAFRGSHPWADRIAEIRATSSV